MTKKDLIKELKKQEDVGDDDEIFVSIVNKANPEGSSSLVPIDYVWDKFINVTF